MNKELFELNEDCLNYLVADRTLSLIFLKFLIKIEY